MSDPFSDVRVDDPFASVRDTGASREDVLKDFTNTDDDVASGGAKDTFEARKGRIAGYIASDKSTDFDTAYNGVEQLGKDLIGSEKADINEVFQGIAQETSIGDAEQAFEEIINRDMILTEGGWVPTEPYLTQGQKEYQASQWEAPERRALSAFSRAYFPEWAHESMDIPEATTPKTKGDIAEDITGSITGTVLAFYTGSKILKGAGGVRAVPQVGSLLTQMASKGGRFARGARLIERGLNTSVVLGGYDQFHSDETSLKERTKMLAQSTATGFVFPFADELSMLGGWKTPAALTAVWGVGALGSETWDEAVINGTSLSIMWGISRGANFRESKRMAEEVAKANGVKDPKAFVDNFIKENGRSKILRGAEKLRDQMYMANIMRDTASTAGAKHNAGQKLLPSEKVATAKANEMEVIAKAQAGEVAPIKADRAVLQSKAIAKGAGAEIAKTVNTERAVKNATRMVLKDLGDDVTVDGKDAVDFIETAMGQNTAEEAIQVVRDAVPSVSENSLKAVRVAFDSGQAEASTPIETESQQEILPPEVIKETGELQLLQDAQTFGIPEEQALQRLMTQSGHLESSELDYNEQLPQLWEPPPEPPNLYSPEGAKYAQRVGEFIQRGAENVAGFFRRFGRQYVSDPVLGKQLEASYHEISAAPHKGILEVHRALSANPRTALDDSVAMTIALESGDVGDVPLKLLPSYRTAEALLKNAEQMQINAGVLTKSFEESQAERLESLDRAIAKASGNKKAELIAERRRIEDIKKYLPHTGVAKAVLEQKLKESPVGGGKSFSKKLSQFHKNRKGTYSLKEYMDMGLLTKEDLDINKLLMSAYVDAYHKIAVKGLIDWGKESGQIVPESHQVLGQDEWVMESDMHPIARIGGVEGMKMSRLFAQGLEELAGTDKKPYNWYSKMLGTIKVGQFFNPAIIFRHNISQAVLGGSFSFNPVTVGKHFTDAFTATLTKNDTWMEADKYGLYQKTDIPTRQTVDQMIQQYASKHRDIGLPEYTQKAIDVMSAVMGITPQEAKVLAQDKQFGKLLEKAWMTAPQMVSNTTWAGDEIQRTMSYLALKEQGYSSEEAANEAARIHGAYSNVGIGYRNIARDYLFVYSFRILMPWQYQVKPWIELADYAYKKATGKKANSKKAKRNAWIIGATTLIPFAYDAYMKSQGWEVDEQERESAYGKFVDKISPDIKIGDFEAELRHPAFPTWRYSKDIETPDGPKKIVHVVNTPNVAFSRFLVRATKSMPENVKNEAGQGIIDATWAEIHPFYKMFRAYALNEPLDYSDEYPRGIDGNEWGKGAGKVMLKTFRVYGAMYEMSKHGLMKKTDADRMLDEHMTVMEKFVGWGGFNYISGTDESRRYGRRSVWEDNVRQMSHQLDGMNLTEEEKAEVKEKFKAKAKDSFKRIKGN